MEKNVRWCRRVRRWIGRFLSNVCGGKSADGAIGHGLQGGDCFRVRKIEDRVRSDG